MSHIPVLHRQAFGIWLVSIFLITFTFLFYITHTGSDDLSTAALLSLISILSFTIVTCVVQTAFIVTFALRLLVSWCTIVFHRTTDLFSLAKHVSDSHLALYLPAFAKTINFTIELLAITLSSIFSTKSGLELLEEGLLTPDESQGPFGRPSFPPVRFEDFHAATASISGPSVATCPPLPNTPRLQPDATFSLGNNINGWNAVPIEPATSSNLSRTTSSSTPTPTARGAARSAPINGTAKSNTISVKKSSIPFPSLSKVPGDAGSISQTGPDVFAEIVALPKRSRNIAQKHLDFANVDKFRGPVLAATAPTRADVVLPARIIIHEVSTSSFSSSGSRSHPASTTSSPHSTSTSTFQTTATTPCSSQIDLHSDVEREVPGAPTATAITAADVKLPKSDDAQNLGEVATSPLEKDVRLRDHQTGSGSRMKIPEFETTENAAQNDYDWKWAKTEGKRPEAPSCELEDDDLDETDDEEEDEEDEQGFSTRAMRKTMAKSKRAAPAGVARLFYGASTSTVVKGPLSQADWDMLEQFGATPSRPKKVVRSPSPASTGVEAEIAVPYWLSAPLPPLPEAAPVKTKLLPRLRKFVKRLVPRNPFKNRG